MRITPTVEQQRIGREVRAQMVRADLTQAQLAERIGCTQQIVSDLVRGCFDPDDTMKAAIADALGASVSALFGAQRSRSLAS